MKLLLILCAVVCVQACYWNSQCLYPLYSSRTPYATVRGDIRDIALPLNCKAVSMWTLNRHGNRNPGMRATKDIKYVTSLKDEIIASHEAGRGQLCEQDVENLREWFWNSSLEVSHAYLTTAGYKELFDLGKRIRQKYPYLLQGVEEGEYLFRPINETRTIDSAIAFVHGLSNGTNITLRVDEATSRDEVIQPYEGCNRYGQEWHSGQIINDYIDAYYKSAEFISVQNTVQQRLGISTKLTPNDIYSLYEICRFERSQTETLRSPWCAAFTSDDLMVLEYRDDVIHYYRKGYGTWFNVYLGGAVLKDLYKTFVTAAKGQGRKITSYFVRSTLMGMVWPALGIYKDPYDLQPTFRNHSRVWRSSYFGALSANLIAVLNSCQESGKQTHRVQLFINEKETEICPPEGCTWQQFQDKFEKFTAEKLDFCHMDKYNSTARK